MQMIQAVIGALLVATPHVGSLAREDALTQAGFSSACGLAAVIGVVWVLSRCSFIGIRGFRRACYVLAAAALFIEGASAVGMLPVGTAGMYCFDQSLRALALSALLTCAVRDASSLQDEEALPGHRMLLGMLALSGVVWSIGISCGTETLVKYPLHGLSVLVAATFAWTLPWIAMIPNAALSRNHAVFVALAPCAGALVGGQAIALIGSIARFSVSVLVLGILLSVPALLSGFALARSWMRQHTLSHADAKSASKEVASSSARAPTQTSLLSYMDGFDLLSKRETTVLEMSVQGFEAREIAQQLGVSVSTVGSHRSRAYQKLGVSSLQDIYRALRALAAGQPASGPAASESSVASHGSAQHIETALVCAIGCFALTLARLFVLQWVVNAVAFTSCLAASVLGVRGLTHCVAVDRPGWADGVAMLCGASSAIGVAMLALAPQSFLALAAVGAFGLLLDGRLQVSYIGRALSPDLGKSLAALHLVVAGVTGLALIPAGPVVLTFSRTPLLPILISAALQIAAFVALRGGCFEVRRLATDIARQGDSRTLAYLEGRGASDLQAKVALLTAYGLDRTAIAQTLFISPATATNYRARAYALLGVHSKEELTRLLTEEAGLSVTASCGTETKASQTSGDVMGEVIKQSAPLVAALLALAVICALGASAALQGGITKGPGAMWSAVKASVVTEEQTLYYLDHLAFSGGRLTSEVFSFDQSDISLEMTCYQDGPSSLSHDTFVVELHRVTMGLLDSYVGSFELSRNGYVSARWPGVGAGSYYLALTKADNNQTVYANTAMLYGQDSANGSELG